MLEYGEIGLMQYISILGILITDINDKKSWKLKVIICLGNLLYFPETVWDFLKPCIEGFVFWRFS